MSEREHLLGMVGAASARECEMRTAIEAAVEAFEQYYRDGHYPDFAPIFSRLKKALGE